MAASAYMQGLTWRTVGVVASAPLPVRAAERASCTAFTAACGSQNPVAASAMQMKGT